MTTQVNKDTPCEADVHALSAGKKPKARSFKQVLTDMMDKKRCKKSTAELVVKADLFKANDEERTVLGWASVIERDGEPIVDHQGDVIDEPTLVKAAHGFISNFRVGKAMHDGQPVSDAVESMVFTRDLQKALGIDLGMVGWLVKFKVNDDAVWKKVKSGELRSFSIGGSGERTPIEA